MPTNLVALNPATFERLCQALLTAELPRFQSFSSPDLGMDGYDQDSGTLFQIYFPEKSPRRDKIAADLAKGRNEAWPCKRWILLIPKNSTPGLLSWLAQQEASLPFTVDVWGAARIGELLRKHPAVRDEYFPSEVQKELRRMACGKKPKRGDARPGQSMAAEQAAEVRQLIDKLVEEVATRKKRRPKPADYAREFGEFNAHFELSSYDRLPATEFSSARQYLESKLYGRRTADTKKQRRNRCVAGIKAIQRDLGITDSSYRAILVRIIGRSSTTLMDLPELERVFEHFKHLQGQAVAAGN